MGRSDTKIIGLESQRTPGVHQGFFGKSDINEINAYLISSVCLVELDDQP
jgi:hypothetical protein